MHPGNQGVEVREEERRGGGGDPRHPVRDLHLPFPVYDALAPALDRKTICGKVDSFQQPSVTAAKETGSHSCPTHLPD